MARAPSVIVTESGQGVQRFAPQTNRALELAGSLRGIEPELNQALTTYAKRQEEKAAAEAETAALKNSGKAFADAVREGKIEPTQNPWFVRHYEIQAAQVRGQQAASDLYAQSQQWAERSDPKAFAAKWAEESGKLAEGFTGPDQQVGFRRALDPIAQQALQGNVQYNVQRVTQEAVQATSANMTTAIEGVLRVNAKAKPEDFYAAIAPYAQSVIDTGGTQKQADLMVKGAIVAAAYKASNPALLDVLNYDRGDGKGAISSQFNANGQGIAEEIATDRYRITEASNAALMGDAKIQKAQREAAGYRLYNWVYQTLPAEDLIKGNLNFNDLVGQMSQATDPTTGQPFTGPAIQAALAILKDEQASNNTLQRALIDQYSNSPEAGLKILSLNTRILKQGLTPSVEADIASAVRTGLIDFNKASSMLSQAASTSQHFASEARQDQRAARSDAKEERRYRLEAERDLRDHVGRVVGNATDALSRAGSPKLARDAGARTAFTRGVSGAMDAWMYAHPGDYQGATKAGEDAANRLLQPELARARASAERRANSTSAGGGNKLRSSGNK